MKRIALLFAFSLSIILGMAQTNTGPDLRPWYSIYAKKKLNHRWSIDGYGLVAMRSMKNDFWLSQFNVGANVRLDRFWTLSLGYGRSFYKHSAWWERNYPQSPNFINTVGFHVLSVGARNDRSLGSHLKVTNRFIVQHYLPRFQKYQTRLQYVLRFGYRRNNLPLRIKPFVQGALYYYAGGEAIDYFDEDFEELDFAAPNGIHRFRLRLGFTFRPIPSYRKMSMTIYYGWNKEFNLPFGRDINVETPRENSDRTRIVYPFNTYGILGIQANFFF